MGLNLTFTSHGLLNTTLVDDDGEAAYKIITVRSGFKRTSTIRRVCGEEEALSLVGISDTDKEEETIYDSSELASIRWNCFTASRLAYGSQVMDITEILTRTGPLALSFAFTGPDGQSYVWDLGFFGLTPGVLQLKSADGSQTVVAKFHKGRRLIKARKPMLEIYEGGMHMLDLLIITFVYVEKMRKGREELAESSGGGG